jgi:hypothetical protein
MDEPELTGIEWGNHEFLSDFFIFLFIISTLIKKLVHFKEKLLPRTK